jgi:hypothetical protein
MVGLARASHQDALELRFTISDSVRTIKLPILFNESLLSSLEPDNLPERLDLLRGVRIAL